VAVLANDESLLLDARSENSLQPDNCRNRHRSLRPDVFVAIGQSTHQGCTPQLRSIAGRQPEYLCPCHVSSFVLAGRVYRGGAAPAHHVIPVETRDARYASAPRLGARSGCCGLRTHQRRLDNSCRGE